MKYFKIYFLALIFLIGCNHKSKNYEPTTKLDSFLKNSDFSQVYYEFRNDNVGLSSGIEKSESFIKFAKETNNDVLISLTDCERPIIRCFAFKALVEKGYPNIREILFKHKNDNEFVEYTASQCIRMNEMVKCYMMQQLHPYSDNKNKFTKTEYEKIKEIFLKK